MKTLESDIVRYRAEYAANLTGDLKQLIEDDDQKVSVELENALKKTIAAVDKLNKADALAKGEEKASVKFDLLDATLSKLSAQADTLVATNRFMTIGNQVLKRAGKTLAGESDALSQKVDAASIPYG